MPLKWAYGVTTVPQRVESHLPRTLESLCNAGFDSPRLFIDGADDITPYLQFGLEITARQPKIRTFGNWILGLAELYIREPACDRYAMFQDDFVTYRNLREFLDKSPYPEKGYLNLYTFPANQQVAKTKKVNKGWFETNQRGLGAVALVFCRDAVTILLHSLEMIERPQDPNRGWRAIDGGIVTVLKHAGWKEYCHTPSLVQHTGLTSSMSNKKQPLAASFKGEQFDAIGFL